MNTREQIISMIENILDSRSSLRSAFHEIEDEEQSRNNLFEHKEIMNELRILMRAIRND